MKKTLFTIVLSLAVGFTLIGCSMSDTSKNNSIDDTARTRSVEENNDRLKEDIINGADDVKNNITDSMNGMMN